MSMGQDDGERVPEEIASAEDGDDVSRQPVEQLGHARMIAARKARRTDFQGDKDESPNCRDARLFPSALCPSPGVRAGKHPE